MRFEREDGTSVVLYYASPEEGQGESTLHQYLVSYVERLLRSGGTSTLHVSSSPEPLPDVETSTKYIEVETGLKRKVDDLEERIRRLSQIKQFVIVVPNGDVAERYGKLARDRVTVKTLRELLLGEW